MSSSSSSLNAFCSILISLVDYVSTEIPSTEKKAAVVKIKLETAIEYGPEQLCKKFVNELRPHVTLILKKDDTFIYEHLPKLDVIKDVNITSVWDSCSPEIQTEIWSRLNTAFTLGSLAINDIVESTAKNMSGFDGQDFDPDQLGGAVQQIMPAVMSMMGPLMQNLGGNRGDKKNAAKQAADPNSPMMQMISNMMGGINTNPDTRGAVVQKRLRQKLDKSKTKTSKNSLL